MRWWAVGVAVVLGLLCGGVARILASDPTAPDATVENPNALDRLLRNGVGDGSDPWLLAHACVALGDRVTCAGSTVPAVDRLIRSHGVRRDANGRELWGFPPPVDPHAYSYISELVRAPIEFAKEVPGLGSSRGEYLRSCSSVIDWGALDPRKELAWPLSATYLERKWWAVRPDRETDEMVDQGFRIYEREQNAYLQGLAARPRQRPPQFDHFTCGGRHLLFALAAAAFSTRASAAWRRSFDGILDGECRRVDFETEYIDRWSRGNEGVRLAALASVLGHHLEVLGFVATRSRGSRVSRRFSTMWRRLEAEIQPLLESMHPERAFGQVSLWRDFYGGLCHARAGLGSYRER